MTRQPAVKDEKPDEAALRWKVAYGRFFPNPDEDAADAARQIAERCRDHLRGRHMELRWLRQE